MHTKLDRFIDRATDVLGWVLLVALALIVASGFYAIAALPGPPQWRSGGSKRQRSTVSSKRPIEP